MPTQPARLACVVVLLSLACSDPASGPREPNPPGALTIPSNVVAYPVGSTTVRIEWTDASRRARGFRVQRSLDGGASWETVGTRTATAGSEPWFGDGGRVPERTACYRVLAFDDVATTAPSAVACATPIAAPRRLVSDTLESGAVEVAWEDGSGLEDGFEIYRIWASHPEPIAQVSSGTTKAVVSDVWSYAATDVYVVAYRILQDRRVYSDWSNAVWVP